MIFNYSNPEGNASYYGNRYDPSYGYKYGQNQQLQQSNVPRNLSSTYAFKKGMSLGQGGLYNTSHGGYPTARHSAYSGKGMGHILASANILRNKLIQIKDYQNGKRVSKTGVGANLVKRGVTHFDRSWTKSLVYGKNYPNNDSKIPHKSIYSYIDHDITDDKYPGYRKRNTDYKSLFSQDNDEEIIRAREEFKKEHKNMKKLDYFNSFKGQNRSKKVKKN